MDDYGGESETGVDWQNAAPVLCQTTLILSSTPLNPLQPPRNRSNKTTLLTSSRSWKGESGMASAPTQETSCSTRSHATYGYFQSFLFVVFWVQSTRSVHNPVHSSNRGSSLVAMRILTSMKMKENLMSSAQVDSKLSRAF